MARRRHQALASLATELQKTNEELEEKAEHKMAEKPLLYVGAAFALGWLLSRVTR